MNSTDLSSSITKLTKLSKGERTRLKIVRAARRILTEADIESLTYQRLAEDCSMSRQLVKSHFPKKVEIVAEVAQLVREDYQAYVVSRLDLSSPPDVLLSEYIRTAIRWPLERGSEISAWLAYLHFTKSEEGFRKQNGFYAKAGLERIIAMLRMCKPRTTLSEHELAIRARTIQNIILGTVVALTTEGGLREGLEEGCVDRSVKLCLDIAFRQRFES